MLLLLHRPPVSSLTGSLLLRAPAHARPWRVENLRHLEDLLRCDGNSFGHRAVHCLELRQLLEEVLLALLLQLQPQHPRKPMAARRKQQTTGREAAYHDVLKQYVPGYVAAVVL